MATKSVTFWIPQNVPGPQNTYFGAGILKIRLILKMRFQNLKNIKKMEPVLLKILCRLEYTLLQNELTRVQNNEKPIWVEIQKHCKNAVTIYMGLQLLKLK